MIHIPFCHDGSSTVAFCLSQEGERQLQQHFSVFSAGLDADHSSALHRALFEPGHDDDIEIHTKNGAVLRIWSHCKWTQFNIVAYFIRTLARAVNSEEFLFVRIGSENLHDTVQAGNFNDNPFHLWPQRRIVFMDDAELVRTTGAEERERVRFKNFWAKEADSPGTEKHPDSSGTCFWETLPCGLALGKMMDVSTKHISMQDDELLDDHSDARGPVPVIAFRKDDVGYFVHVPHDDIEESEREMRQAGYSEEFIGLLRIARSEGASMLCLAADSTPSDKLPSFDW